MSVETIGGRIRELRDQRGWSKNELARRLAAVRPGSLASSWRNSVGRWENNGDVPRRDQSEALADAFDVPAQEFLPADLAQAEADRMVAAIRAAEREIEERDRLIQKMQRQLAERMAEHRQMPEQGKPGSRMRRD